MKPEYVSVSVAQSAAGLRLIAPRAIPSPWSEAVKGMLTVCDLPWLGIYLDQKDEQQFAWSGRRDAPVLFDQQQAPLHHWRDIMLRLQQLSASDRLLPEDKKMRQQVLTWCGFFADPQGLGWYRRLLGVKRGLAGERGGYSPGISHYLGKKYGYQQQLDGHYEGWVVERLQQLAQQLRQQQKLNSHYLIGQRLTAADIYCAAFSALFSPLPESQCAMLAPLRQVFEYLSDAEQQALDPLVLQHRDYIYQHYLSLPLSL